VSAEQQKKIGADQIINLIWIACIIGLIAMLYLKEEPQQVTWVEVTGGCIAELAKNGQITRDGITIAWHGDTLCDPDELRLAAKRLVEMADKADKGGLQNNVNR
jgi:uncharacterized protein YrrD